MLWFSKWGPKSSAGWNVVWLGCAGPAVAWVELSCWKALTAARQPLRGAQVCARPSCGLAAPALGCSVELSVGMEVALALVLPRPDGRPWLWESRGFIGLLCGDGLRNAGDVGTCFPVSPVGLPASCPFLQVGTQTCPHVGMEVRQRVGANCQLHFLWFPCFHWVHYCRNLLLEM